VIRNHGGLVSGGLEENQHPEILFPTR
jgi:hypothetical protein